MATTESGVVYHELDLGPPIKEEQPIFVKIGLPIAVASVLCMVGGIIALILLNFLRTACPYNSPARNYVIQLQHYFIFPLIYSAFITVVLANRMLPFAAILALLMGFICLVLIFVRKIYLFGPNSTLVKPYLNTSQNVQLIFSLVIIYATYFIPTGLFLVFLVLCIIPKAKTSNTYDQLNLSN